LAGERDWREKKKAFEAALEVYEDHTADDEEATDRVRKDFLRAFDEMFAAGAASSVDYVIEEHLAGSRDLVSLVLNKLGALTDEKAVKALLNAYKGARVEEQILLTPSVGRLSGSASISALSRNLRTKDDELLLAVVQALGSRGGEAKEEATKLKRHLRSDSLRIRWATAMAIEALEGLRPAGFPDPTVGPLGVPDRLWSDRVAFLLDATEGAGEVDFVNPLISKEDAAKATEPVPPVSAYGLIGDHLGDVFKDADPTAAPQVAVSRYGRSAQTYSGGYAKLRRPKDLLGLAKWFDRPLRDRDRDVAEALASALERDPAPDEVYLFLTGLPSGRRAGAPEAVVDRLRELAWRRSVRVHVTAFLLEPAKEPIGAQGKDALTRAQDQLRSFANQLAGVTGGRSTIVEMSRPAKPTASSGADASETEVGDLGVDLTKPISSRDFRTVNKAFRDALKADAVTEAVQKRVEDVASCPDPKVAELALSALSWERPELAQAAARGLSRNAEEKVRDAVLQELMAEKGAARQLLLLQAYGAGPGQDVTDGLVDCLGRLGPDAARLAWRYLSERPEAELAEAGQLKRAARDLEGLAGYYASVALSRASGSPPPSTSGLTTGGAQLLPTRFVSSGVAFLVDTHREMESVFQEFPAPEPTKNDPEPKAPPPATRLDAVRHELSRALTAAKTASMVANVIQLNGRSLTRQAGRLEKAQGAAAQDYVDGLRTGTHRDVWAGLEQALRDPGVESIYLLVCGAPLRSPGSRDVAAFHAMVREMNRSRGVAIEVVLVLGPEPEEGPQRAAEQDFINGLEVLYRPIAEESGGQLLIRRNVGDLKPAK
jgi:hypothetical protein